MSSIFFGSKIFTVTTSTSEALNYEGFIVEISIGPVNTKAPY
jgi:hypothetical protein